VSTGFMVDMSLYAHVPCDAVKEFAPITMVAYSPNVIVVNSSVPAKSVKGLARRADHGGGRLSRPGGRHAHRRAGAGRHAETDRRPALPEIAKR